MTCTHQVTMTGTAAMVAIRTLTSLLNQVGCGMVQTGIVRCSSLSIDQVHLATNWMWDGTTEYRTVLFPLYRPSPPSNLLDVGWYTSLSIDQVPLATSRMWDGTNGYLTFLLATCNALLEAGGRGCKVDTWVCQHYTLREPNPNRLPPHPYFVTQGGDGNGYKI
jgi:hypothetical protein